MPVAVVPDRGGYQPARAGHADLLGERLGRIGHEVQGEQRHRAIEGAVGEIERPRVADDEADAPPRCPLARRGDVVLGGIDAGDVRLGPGLEDGGRERAGPGADIEHRLAVLDARELDEQRREAAAPPSHEGLVGVALREHHDPWNAPRRIIERPGEHVRRPRPASSDVLVAVERPFSSPSGRRQPAVPTCEPRARMCRSEERDARLAPAPPRNSPLHPRAGLLPSRRTRRPGFWVPSGHRRGPIRGVRIGAAGPAAGVWYSSGSPRSRRSSLSDDRRGGPRSPGVPTPSGPVAQLAEQQTLNLLVEGSTPSRLTNFPFGQVGFAGSTSASGLRCFAPRP